MSWTDLRLHQSFTDQVQPSGMSGLGGGGVKDLGNQHIYVVFTGERGGAQYGGECSQT